MHNWDLKQNSDDPFTLTRKSGKKYIFNCAECKHDICTPLYCIQRGQWCKFCTNQKLCGKCDYCYNKSITASRLMEYWHPTKNVNCNTDIIIASTTKKYWFHCKKCFHEFYRLPNDLIRQKNI